ncbi:MAG: hypothetical protein C7B43_16445 [Sulfobacillus benefaciens]|uniref:Uncharacterized protein n=1 Tax=Sulfobacillus benefaciens TaxID=453960 RepID=A0A2T2WTU7_9FIRM|nr:MAG: hypothetical protein C7B43_16445 [Sulfobacillus benefaciens]
MTKDWIRALEIGGIIVAVPPLLAVGYAIGSHLQVHWAASPRASVSHGTPASSSSPSSSSVSFSPSPSPSLSVPSSAAATSAPPSVPSPSWQTLNLNQWGTVSLPASWGGPQQESGSNGGTTLNWTGSSGTFTFSVLSDYGANHNVLLQNSPFDPAEALPAGCSLTGHPHSRVWTFSGPHVVGDIFTTGSLSGAYVATVSDASSATDQRLLDSLILYGSDFSSAAL